MTSAGLAVLFVLGLYFQARMGALFPPIGLINGLGSAVVAVLLAKNARRGWPIVMSVAWLGLMFISELPVAAGHVAARDVAYIVFLVVLLTSLVSAIGTGIQRFAVPPISFGRPHLSGLGRMTLVALLALLVLGLYLQLFIFQALLPPIGLVLAVGSLITAALVAKQWRWAPAAGSAWCALMLAGNATAIVRDLSNPDDTANFVFNLWAAPVLVIGLAAGVGATVQNYRRPQLNRAAARWLPSALVLLLGVALGGSLVALIPRPAAADVAPDVLASASPLIAQGMQFDQTELHARTGEILVLQLANRDALEHSFDIDELNVHTFLPGGKARVAMFRPSKPGTYSFYCGIPGYRDQMHGVLVVEQ